MAGLLSQVIHILDSWQGSITVDTPLPPDTTCTGCQPEYQRTTYHVLVTKVRRRIQAGGLGQISSHGPILGASQKLEIENWLLTSLELLTSNDLLLVK